MAARDLGIDELASFVFLGNKNDCRIDLQICHGLETAKDLFCFFLDMLCKGLVLLFGQDGRVELPDVTAEQLQQVQTKLALMGVRCEIATEKLDYVPHIVEVLHRMHKLARSPENLSLQDYAYEIVCHDTLYTVTFRLFHNVAVDPPAGPLL